MLIKNSLACIKKLTFKKEQILKRWSHSIAKKQHSYIHNIGKEPLAYKTIGDLIDSTAEKYPNRDAVIFCEENYKLTFSELKKQTDKLAAGLLAIGLKKGEKLALWGLNSSHWYLSFLSAAKIGIISVLINPVYQITELEFCLNKTDVSTILTLQSYKTQKYYEILKKLCPQLDEQESGQHLNDKLKLSKVKTLKNFIIASDKKIRGTYQFQELFQLGEDYKDELNKAINDITPDDRLCIQFSSGTTGTPKAPVLSHFNFFNNSLQISRHNQLYDKHHRHCIASPFFHAFATAVCLFPCLHSGTTFVVPSFTYNPLKVLETIEKHKCTYVNGTPTMFVDFVELQKRHKFNLSSLEYAMCGGAPCPPILFQDMLNVLNIKRVKSVYGLTETTAVIFQSLPGEREDYIFNSVGHIQDHIEARIVDEHGKPVPFGTPGELQIRGYCTMLEYYKDEIRTRETKELDGWLKTGDQFVLYENGYGQIIGRIKEMIIRGGENIFPKEIEDFLNTHPKILENYVVGVKDQRMGEEMCVFLRTADGSTFTRDDLIEHCLGKIAKFKIPKYMEIVTDFPKTASGKVQKFKLREIYENKFSH